MIIKRQDENAVLLRPLNQHLAGARRGQQEAHRVEELTPAHTLHAPRQIEAERCQGGPPQRLLIDIERLLDDRGFGRPDNDNRTRGVEVCRGVITQIGCRASSTRRPVWAMRLCVSPFSRKFWSSVKKLSTSLPRPRSINPSGESATET